jgi:hypothetical protein
MTELREVVIHDVPDIAVFEWLTSMRDGYGFPLDGKHTIWDTLPGGVRIVGMLCLSQMDGSVKTDMTILVE